MESVQEIIQLPLHRTSSYFLPASLDIFWPESHSSSAPRDSPAKPCWLAFMFQILNY